MSQTNREIYKLPKTKFIGRFIEKKLYKSSISLSTPLLSFLNSSIFPQFFFQSKENDKKFLALGILEKLSPEWALKIELPQEINLFGFLFFDKKIDSSWEGFETPFFFLPKFEITKENNKTILSYYSYKEEVVELHLEGSTSTDKKGSLETSEHFPSYPLWEKMIIEECGDISKGLINKIVLARKTLFKIEKIISFNQTIENLLKVPHTHTFAIIINKNIGFFGASPETLFSRNNSFLETEAIASTRKRGATEIEDLQLEKEMRTNRKDLIEFGEVQKGIENTLTRFCSKVKRTPLFVYKNSFLQHLCCRFQAKTTMDSYSIIHNLHPTPAIGGLPKEEASNRIHKLEPFSRRLYSSVLGIRGKEEEEFIIAIRSFIINNNTLTAFAGVGIVEESSPQKEWQELNWKIESILKGAGYELSCRNLCSNNH